MSGTKAGAAKYKQNMIDKLGKKGFSDYQSVNGRKGGTAPHTRPRGFASMTPERVRELGAKGGNTRWEKG